MIREFVKDKNEAALVFRMLESESKVKDEEIKMQQNLVSQFKPMFQNPQDKDLLKIVEKIIAEAKSTNSYYRFILYVLEAIVLERPESITDDQQQQKLTDKDRRALDWLHKNMEHNKGEGIGL
jgi:hypothetical protein